MEGGGGQYIKTLEFKKVTVHDPQAPMLVPPLGGGGQWALDSKRPNGRRGR